jgi:hypothetical protein
MPHKPINRPLSDFTYQLADGLLLIEDLDMGNRSVTNDLENVLLTIATLEGVNLEDYAVAYRDSQGIYDGVRLQDGRPHIYSLNLRTEEAVRAHFGRRPSP